MTYSFRYRISGFAAALSLALSLAVSLALSLGFSVVLVTVVAGPRIAAGASLADDAGPLPPHADADLVCLDQKQRRAEAEAGKLVPLATAMHAARNKMPGTVVRARLCRGGEGLLYLLTVLARDGKVRRVAVDAVKGVALGER
jgi:hypothetical protein